METKQAVVQGKGKNLTGRVVHRKEKNCKQRGVLFKTQMNSTMLQSLISLSSVVEFLSFYDDSVPLFSLLKPNEFPFNFIFN